MCLITCPNLPTQQADRGPVFSRGEFARLGAVRLVGGGEDERGYCTGFEDDHSIALLQVKLVQFS